MSNEDPQTAFGRLWKLVDVLGWELRTSGHEKGAYLTIHCDNETLAGMHSASPESAAALLLAEKKVVERAHRRAADVHAEGQAQISKAAFIRNWLDRLDVRTMD